MPCDINLEARRRNFRQVTRFLIGGSVVVGTTLKPHLICRVDVLRLGIGLPFEKSDHTFSYLSHPTPFLRNALF